MSLMAYPTVTSAPDSPPLERRGDVYSVVISAMGGAMLGVSVGGSMSGAILCAVIGALIGGIAADQANKNRRSPQ